MTGTPTCAPLERTNTTKRAFPTAVARSHQRVLGDPTTGVPGPDRATGRGMGGNNPTGTRSRPRVFYPNPEKKSIHPLTRRLGKGTEQGDRRHSKKDAEQMRCDAICDVRLRVGVDVHSLGFPLFSFSSHFLPVRLSSLDGACSSVLWPSSFSFSQAAGASGGQQPPAEVRCSASLY